MDGSLLKEIFAVQFKARHDSYTDQFQRIFMSRLLFVSSVLMSVDYFSDDVNCMTPEDTQHSSNFYHSACWISGPLIFVGFLRMGTSYHKFLLFENFLVLGLRAVKYFFMKC